ncbi:MAG TPA: nuclear transport factor 2 family protein [Acidimicrobiales bacterium]|nr:nuclear transport factor 2 family protein [Acidimicrobiales bacterium]
MPAYPYDELKEMVDRWLDANRRSQEEDDWTILADMFTEDATYGWNIGPKEDFMAVGRDEIRDVAVGLEMGGLDGWTYPYQKVLIDEHQGEIVGFWKQIAGAPRPGGGTYEVPGLGGSWFRYGGDFKWAWQRDFFDVGNATAIFMEMIRDETLSPGMTKRMERAVSGNRLPGHYRVGEAPVGLWD